MKLTKQDQKKFDELVMAFNNGVVLGMCGAGASIPLGYPTWNTLARMLVAELERSSRTLPDDMHLTLDARRADLPRLCQWIRKRLDERDYHTFLESIFKPRAPVEFSDEYAALVSLPVRLWMTTNYDSCLQQALRLSLSRNIQPTTSIPFSELLEGRETLPLVTHLHGMVSAPDTIVLTKDDYDRLYQNNRPIPHSIGSLGAFTVFFYGYELGDSELNACLKSTQLALGHQASTHFALIPRTSGQSPFELELRELELREAGVKPIFYEVHDGLHTERLEALSQLLGKLGITAPLAQPEKERLSLFWEDDRELNDLRKSLHRMLGSQIGRTVVLTSCALQEKRLELGGSRVALEEIRRRAVENEHFLQRPPTAQPPPSTRTYCIRGTDGQALPLTSGAIPSKSDQCAGSGPSDDPTQLAHFAMLEQAAKGNLHPDQHEHAEVLPAMLPEKIPFGWSDVFHPVIDWRLDSPIVHVWVYTDDSRSTTSPISTRPTPTEEDERDDFAHNIVAVVAVGTGLREIREELEHLAYIIALSMPPDAGNVVARGFIRLRAPILIDEQARPSRISMIVRRVFGTNQEARALEVDASTREALGFFVMECERYEQQTGFVRVHHAPHLDLVKYNQMILRNRLQLGNLRHTLIVEPAAPRVLDGMPFWLCTEQSRELVKLTLPLSAIRSRNFSELMDAYYQATVAKMLSDTKRRLEFWKNELESHIRGVEWYKKLSSKEKAELRDVIADKLVLPGLAVTVDTAPQRVPPDQYYLVSLPNFHIPRARRYVERFKQLIEPLQKLETEEYSIVWRRCLARIIDCTLRDVPLCDDEALNARAADWKREADGLLRVAWFNYLSQRGARAEDFFRRTTYFDVTLDLGTNNIEIVANAVIDSSQTTLVFEKKGLLAVHPVDFAVTLSTAIEENNATAEIEKQLRDSHGESSKLGDLTNTMYENPGLLLQLCSRVLATEGQSQLAQAERIIQLATASNGGGVGIALLNNQCLNSVSELIRNAGAFGKAQPGMVMLDALLECNLEGVASTDALERTSRGESRGIREPLRSKLIEVVAKDRAVLERFLHERRIWNDEPNLAPVERAVWEFESCLESCRIAAAWNAAVESLDPEGETLTRVFYKTERAFEAALSGVFSSAPSDADTELRILCGAPLPDSARTESH